MTVSQAVKIINITQPLLHDAPSIIAERGFHRSVTPGQVAIEVGVVFFFAAVLFLIAGKQHPREAAEKIQQVGVVPFVLRVTAPPLVHGPFLHVMWPHTCPGPHRCPHKLSTSRQSALNPQGPI